MSATRRPEKAALPSPGERSQRHNGILLPALVLIPLLSLVPLAYAQGGDARQAIERLENCNKNDSKQACVKILKREPAGKGKQAVKAQIRGGRIIWYEYDTRTGKVRRTN